MALRSKGVTQRSHKPQRYAAKSLPYGVAQPSRCPKALSTKPLPYDGTQQRRYAFRNRNSHAQQRSAAWTCSAKTLSRAPNVSCSGGVTQHRPHDTRQKALRTKATHSTKTLRSESTTQHSRLCSKRITQQGHSQDTALLGKYFPQQICSTAKALRSKEAQQGRYADETLDSSLRKPSSSCSAMTGYRRWSCTTGGARDHVQ